MSGEEEKSLDQTLFHFTEEVKRLEKTIAEMQRHLNQMRIDVEVMKRSGLAFSSEVKKSEVVAPAVTASGIVALIEGFKWLFNHVF